MDTSSGRKFQNLETQRLYEQGTQGAEKENSPAGESNEEETPIENVVDEHGPADEATMKHDEDGYSVESTHGEHKHHSKHKSVKEATDQMMKAHGEEPEGGDSRGGGDEADEEEGEESIPTMRG